MTAPVNDPTSTVAAMAWLEHVLPAAVTVARALPAEANVTPAMREWGIVVPRIVGGGAGPDEAPMREPMIAAECWMPPATAQSTLVPLNRGERLANWVWKAARQDPPTGYTLDPTALGIAGGYRRVWVRTVSPMGEPREIPDDPSNYARFDVTLHFHWTEL